MRQMTSEDREAFFQSDWFKGRPPDIQAMARKCPPGIYRMKGSGLLCQIQTYDEDGTVRVAITAELNIVFMERGVFGVSPDDLTLVTDEEIALTYVPDRKSTQDDLGLSDEEAIAIAREGMRCP